MKNNNIRIANFKINQQFVAIKNQLAINQRKLDEESDLFVKQEIETNIAELLKEEVKHDFALLVL